MRPPVAACNDWGKIVDVEMLWNAALTLILGLVGWMLRSWAEELKRLQILLNRTREEVAKDYVTKAEVHADINRVIMRLESLDSKIDRLIERMGKA